MCLINLRQRDASRIVNKKTLRSLPKREFLKLMGFHEEWLNMYPDELARIQVESYEPGGEKSPEHFRFGAFCWWEKNITSKKEAEKLIELSYLDSDPKMAAYAKTRIRSVLARATDKGNG